MLMNECSESVAAPINECRPHPYKADTTFKMITVRTDANGKLMQSIASLGSKSNTKFISSTGYTKEDCSGAPAFIRTAITASSPCPASKFEFNKCIKFDLARGGQSYPSINGTPAPQLLTLQAKVVSSNAEPSRTTRSKNCCRRCSRKCRWVNPTFDTPTILPMDATRP